MSDYGITVEFQDSIGIVTLSRPEKRNSFDEKMWEDLVKAVDILKENLPRAIILTGAGEKAFSAGFDVNPQNPQVNRLVDAVMNHKKEPVQELIKVIRNAVDAFTSLPVPIIAAINGLAYGGGAELASRCDIRIGDPSAKFCFSEVKLGLMPDWGGGVAVTRLIGTARAAELILSAREIDTEEALSIGLINSISEKNNCLKEAIELALQIAENGPRAVGHALKVIRNTPDLSYANALNYESEQAIELIASGECVHGITAFMKKEKPKFPDIQ